MLDASLAVACVGASPAESEAYPGLSPCNVKLNKYSRC